MGGQRSKEMDRMGAIRKQGPSGCPAEQVFGEVDAQTGCDPDFHIDGLMAGEREWDWNDGGKGSCLECQCLEVFAPLPLPLPQGPAGTLPAQGGHSAWGGPNPEVHKSQLRPWYFLCFCLWVQGQEEGPAPGDLLVLFQLPGPKLRSQRSRPSQ